MKQEIVFGIGVIALLFLIPKNTAPEIIPEHEPLQSKLPRSMGGDYTGDETDE